MSISIMNFPLSLPTVLHMPFDEPTPIPLSPMNITSLGLVSALLVLIPPLSTFAHHYRREHLSTFDFPNTHIKNSRDNGGQEMDQDIFFAAAGFFMDNL